MSTDSTWMLAAAVTYLEVVRVMNRLTYVFAKELKYCISEKGVSSLIMSACMVPI